MQVLSQLFNPLDQLEELKSENAAVRSFLDQAAGNFVIFQVFLATKRNNILLLLVFAYFDILLFCSKSKDGNGRSMMWMFASMGSASFWA